MAEFAPAMIQALEGTNESRGRFVLAPSLARAGSTRIVWNQELAQHDPDLIVILVGFWEDKVVGEAAATDPAWPEQYKRQVVEPFLDLLTGSGAKVLWIGMAAVNNPPLTARLARLNFVYHEVAEERDDVEFIPAGDYLSGPNGAYADVLPSTVTGQPVRVRRTDGLHICPDGVDRLGEPVLDAITEQWNVTAAFNWQQGSWRRPPLLHAPEECPAPV
jgi:hypothetical protein